MKHNTKPNNMKINKAKKYKKLMVTRTMCLDCLSCALIVIFALRRSHFFYFWVVLFCFLVGQTMGFFEITYQKNRFFVDFPLLLLLSNWPFLC